MAGNSTSFSYCAEEVRRFDRDRFLTALFAPADRRANLMALYAFNLEIAKVRELVSEPILGQVRLQWWREAMDGIYNGTPLKHAVAEALSAAVRTCALPRADIERLIDGREFDLANDPPDDMTALVRYAEATSSTLVELALRVLGIPTEAEREAAHHAGVAHALAGLVRAVPFFARQRRLMIPTTVMREVNLHPRDVLELRPVLELKAAAKRIADEASLALEKAMAACPRPRRAMLPALMTATLARSHLRTLARNDYDLYRPVVAEKGGGAGRLLALWRAELTGRV